MEQYMDTILLIVGSIGLAAGFAYRHWATFGVVYKCAKSAYWVVEAVAVEKGLVSKEKTDLFEKKFRYLMKWVFRFVTKERMKLAFELAKKFSAKYKKVEKSDKSNKKQHIIGEDKTVIWVPTKEV